MCRYCQLCGSKQRPPERQPADHPHLREGHGKKTRATSTTQMSTATSDVKKKPRSPHGDQGRAIPPPQNHTTRILRCAYLSGSVSGRRKAQSAGESSDVVAWRSEMKGAQNVGKERVRVGQLDDDGSARVLDDAGDSEASKLRYSATQRCLQFAAGNTSHTQQLGQGRCSSNYDSTWSQLLPEGVFSRRLGSSTRIATMAPAALPELFLPLDKGGQ